MATGISMSIINKIKELYDAGDYSLALDVINQQDLSKTLSPQFIKTCGEVYYENGIYSEARASLVKAHSMAPMGNKILYSLIKLYLSMGLFELAEKYYEIYKFNQDEKEAGAIRIEYLIAKAYRKSVIELYSILISANDLETDEEWDYEMVLVHAAMKNVDKLKEAAAVFKLTYKNSNKLNQVQSVVDDISLAEDLIYIFPEKKTEEDYPEMDETREFEKTVLESDELRMHPKDPKIMIMVEDIEPVPNSIKFKTKLMRNKELKREKKERASEEKTGWFNRNRMSRKDEEAFEEVIQEMTEQRNEKQSLLEEVLKTDDDFEANEAGEVVAEDTSKENSEEMTEIKDELKPEEKATFIREKAFEVNAFDDSLGDLVNFDEGESVVMVDMENLDEDEAFAEDETDFDEFADSEPDFDEPVDDEKIVEEIPDEFVEEAPEEVFEEINEEVSKEVIEETQDEIIKESADEEIEDTEKSSFDFDEAFSSLDGFDVEEDIFEEIEEVPEEVIEEVSEEIIEEIPEEVIEEVSEEIIEEDDFEENLVEEEIDEIITEDDFEINDVEEFPVEEEIRVDEIPDDFEIEEEEEFQVEEILENFEIEEEEEFQVDEIPEDFEIEEEEEFQVDEISVEEENPIEEEIPTEKEIPVEEKFEDFSSSYKKSNLDFPVFRSSLFPDYNRDNPPVVAYEEHKNEVDEVEETKIKENLKKEADLLDETDRLLARLGIELGTNYSSGADMDVSSRLTESDKSNISSDMKDQNPFKLKH